MHVIEHQYEGLLGCKQRQQRAQSVVELGWLDRPRSRFLKLRKRREHARQDRCVKVTERCQPAPRDGAEIRVEGIDQDAERELALELGGAAGGDHGTAIRDPRESTGQQPGLTDARLPGHGYGPRLPPGQRRFQSRQLAAAAHQRAHVPQGYVEYV